MCTLTFLPLGSEEYLFTSNRDEALDREKAFLPAGYEVHGQKVFFPRDGRANGTWVAASAEVSLCLLNGAFHTHRHKPPYRMSRGLVLLEYFNYRNAEAFASEFDFSGIEPFTLVIIEDKPKTSLHELRWDEKQVHIRAVDASQPAVWSSVTLYGPEKVALRKSWFEKWLEEAQQHTFESIIDFHHMGGSGDTENALLMHRENGIQTLSITCIAKQAQEKTMIYEDTISKALSHTPVSA